MARKKAGDVAAEGDKLAALRANVALRRTVRDKIRNLKAKATWTLNDLVTTLKGIAAAVDETLEGE